MTSDATAYGLWSLSAKTFLWQLSCNCFGLFGSKAVGLCVWHKPSIISWLSAQSITKLCLSKDRALTGHSISAVRSKLSAGSSWPDSRAWPSNPERIHRPAEYVHHHLNILRENIMKAFQFLPPTACFPTNLQQPTFPSPNSLPPFCQTAAGIVSYAFTSLKNAGPLGTLNFKACFPSRPPTTNKHADIYSWRKLFYLFRDLNRFCSHLSSPRFILCADEGHDWCFS